MSGGVPRLAKAARTTDAPELAQVSPDEVLRIAALHDQPVLRNLLITQAYHDLSRQLEHR
jgi:hypothetical protein